MLFDLFLFANLNPYSLILLRLFLIQMFCWFLFPYCVFFWRQRVMIHSIVFVSLIVLSHNITYCLDLFLRGLWNHLLLVMNVDCLLQWLHTLIINSTFWKHRCIAPLRPIRLWLGYHILFNVNNLAGIGLYHLMDIPGHGLLLLIRPLYLWISLELYGAACFTLKLYWRHHSFLESLGAVYHYVRADGRGQLQFRQVVLLYWLVLLTCLLFQRVQRLQRRVMGKFLAILACNQMLFPVGLALLWILLVVDAVP